MVTEQAPIEDWATLPWRQLERVVYRLQRRIYRIFWLKPSCFSHRRDSRVTQ